MYFQYTLNDLQERSSKKEFSYITFFAGGGGSSCGYKLAGGDVRYMNEFQQIHVDTYLKNFPNTVHECKDIKQVTGKGIMELTGLKPYELDLLDGSPPCPPFSMAGTKREGWEQEKIAYGMKQQNIEDLTWEQIRIAGDLMPKVIVCENVKGLSSHDKGKTAEVIKDTLRVLGYSVFWNILNTSKLTNVPQNRERTIIVGFRDEAGWEDSKDMEFPLASTNFDAIYPPKNKKRNRSIRDLLETDVDEKYYYGPDKYMYKELKASMKNPETAYQWRRKYVRENQSNEMFTLTANMGTGGHNVPLIIDDKGFRKLTPRECFNFQGFPKSFKLPTDVADGQLYKQAGNAVTVPLMKLIGSKIKIALESKYSSSLTKV